MHDGWREDFAVIAWRPPGSDSFAMQGGPTPETAGLCRACFDAFGAFLDAGAGNDLAIRSE